LYILALRDAFMQTANQLKLQKTVARWNIEMLT